MAEQIASFLQINDLALEPWKMATASGPQSIPDALEDWDAATDLSFLRRIQVSMGELSEETGLAAGSRVRVTSGWFCERTRTRKCSWKREFVIDDSIKLIDEVLTAEVSGAEVAQAITLETRIVLVEATTGSSELAARTPGAVLHSDSRDILLEGIGSRFPVEWIDFAGTSRPIDAPWYLSWDHHAMDSSALGVLRLYVNARHKTVSAALRGEEGKIFELVRSVVTHDVTRQLIAGALMSDEFVDDPRRYDETSLGGVLARLVDHVFDEPPHSVREMIRTDPARFEAHVSSAVKLLGVES